MTPPPDDAVAALLAELQEIPLPGARYAYTVVKRHAAGWTLARRSERDALVVALEGMIGLATHGAARDHLDQAGVMQDPPHGWGKYAECEAPWCVRNQKRIAAARAAIEGGRT